MEADAALVSLCTSPPNTYLSVPQGSPVQLDVILTEFCSNNWTAVAKEVLSEVDRHRLGPFLFVRVASTALRFL